MAYQIKIGVFEGPFDLLFHLIEKNEIDIYDIPVAEITAQYLDYLATMEMLDLEVASEFLVMAATLLAIKAAMLLPRPAAAGPAEVEEDYDPRQELVEKLLEYKKFKDAAGYLQQRETLMGQVYTRPNTEEMFSSLFREENPLEGISLFSLLDALQEALERSAGQEVSGEIPRDKVTVRGQMKEIMRRLAWPDRGVAFRDLFRPQATKTEVVVTFLALLELIRLGRLRACQARAFGEIIIYRRDRETAAPGQETAGA